MRNFEWQLRFAKLVADSQDRPFEWGVFDCARFAAQSVEAITGVDPWPGLEYSTEKEARRLMREGLKEFADKALGAQIDPALAQIGDVGLYDQPAQGETLCVWGGRAWLAPSVNGGLATVPAPFVAWRCVRA